MSTPIITINNGTVIVEDMDMPSELSIKRERDYGDYRYTIETVFGSLPARRIDLIAFKNILNNDKVWEVLI